MAAPKNPNTEAARAALAAKRAAEKREKAIREARMLLRDEEGYLVISRDEVIEMLSKPIYADGLSAYWLRGYLKISESELPPRRTD